MDTKTFPVRRSARYDVVVVGGGSTGITAALAAARHGARVALVECYGFLGGNSAAIKAWLGFHSVDGKQVVDGIPMEMIRCLQACGGATRFHPDPIRGSAVAVNPDWWKIVAMEAACEAGIDIWMHSMVVGVKTGDGDGRASVTGVYIHSKEGLALLATGAVIDRTDTGDILKHAGVPLLRGREEDNCVQVSSWVFSVTVAAFLRTAATPCGSAARAFWHAFCCLSLIHEANL